MASSSRILQILFISSFVFALSSSLTEQPKKPTREVNLGNPELHFTPSKLDGSTPTSGSNDISCERVRVAGVSMVNIKSYANSYRVTLTPSAAIPERFHSKIEVCFHRNASLGLCQCGKDEWKTIQKGQWIAVMSPYEDRYVDVKVLGGTGAVTVSVNEDFHQWRLYCLVSGFVLLLIAPIISDWVPFYYSSSMVVGVLLVVLILLFQGMKLLPTGRKSAFYFTIYGSLVGLGSYLVHYFSMLINSILVSFGLSEDMYNPVSIVVGVVIVLCGAALGYWVVRKYVISEDGRVDAGIAQFVKWAVRIIAMTSILQSTLDARLAILAMASCLCISAGAQRGYTRLTRKKGNLWLQKAARQTSGGRRSAEFHSRSAGKAFGKMSWASPKKAIPFTISPSRGYYSPSPVKRGMVVTPERDYPSTFHDISSRKRFSKKDWADFTNESTKEALAELASTPEFTDWIVENADRIQLQPEDSSDDSMESDGVSSEETVVDSGGKLGLFGWR